MVSLSRIRRSFYLSEVAFCRSMCVECIAVECCVINRFRYIAALKYVFLLNFIGRTTLSNSTGRVKNMWWPLTSRKILDAWQLINRNSVSSLIELILLNWFEKLQSLHQFRHSKKYHSDTSQQVLWYYSKYVLIY